MWTSDGSFSMASFSDCHFLHTGRALSEKDIPSVTRCHQVALSGSLGPHPGILAPNVSRVLYSSSYVGPRLFWSSNEGNVFTSENHLRTVSSRI